MKKFKTQSQPTQKPARPASQPTNKQEIDAAIQHLSKFIESNPEKAAKIFEGWLQSAAQSKKTNVKKPAA